MPTHSLVTGLDLKGPREGLTEHKPECTFWTGRDGQMCVQHFRPAVDVLYQPHTHSEYTLVVCLAGEILKTQFGETEAIGPGEAMMGNHGVERSSGYLGRKGNRCEAVSLSLEPRLLAGLTKDFDLPAMDGVERPAFAGKVANTTLHECARAIAAELRACRPGHQIVIETLATRLLVEAMRAWPRANITKTAADPAPRLPRRDFVRAYEFMRWCRKEHFRLEHLCRFLGSSEERFTRLFLASTQHTPASFYNRMLLERARDLLRDPELSIKEIGFQLGFKTSSHFVAAFRRAFTASPQEYRVCGILRQRSPFHRDNREGANQAADGDYREGRGGGVSLINHIPDPDLAERGKSVSRSVHQAGGGTGPLPSDQFRAERPISGLRSIDHKPADREQRHDQVGIEGRDAAEEGGGYRRRAKEAKDDL